MPAIEALELELHLPVTQQHIDRGVPCSSLNCPIAEAAFAAGFQYVTVEYSRAFLDDLDWVASESAEEFIAAFDEDKPVEPFTAVYWLAESNIEP